jgi:uncharacterized protein (DUF736 family)
MQNFAIFKAKEKKNEKSPDYNISMKVGEKFVNIGGAWLKESKGQKYFSCSLSKPYKAQSGWEITEVKGQPAEQVQTPAVPYPTEQIDPNEIPF